MEGYWSLKIRRAVVMSANALGDKKVGNIPYIFLNMGTAIILALLKAPEEMITASILQGTLKTLLKPELIKSEFGSDVLMSVLVHKEPYWPMFWKDQDFSIFPELQEYSIERIFDSIKMGALAHGDQRRKEKNILFFCHPLMVALLLALLRAKEYQIIAGILHDTLEDTKLPVEAIGDAFGPDVLHIVLSGTELDKTQEWEERKQQTIQRLYEAELDVKMDICADKLDNLQSIYDVLLAEGCNNPGTIQNAEVWQSFARGYDSQKWYYQCVVKALFYGIEKIESPPNIFGTLLRLTENIFGERLINDEAIRAKVPSRH
jgi:(p)ppGpp synthase/HD superfamily hydrolase